MLKSVEIQNFFSFRDKEKISLNKGVNLLLGINGSGKTSFINALRILSEGICGKGLIDLIQRQWGGFDEIINANGAEKAQYARINFVFDCKSLNELQSQIRFNSDIVYRITINRSGTSYYLGEKIFSKGGELDRIFTYLNFRNGRGKLSTRNPETGVISFQQFDPESVSGQESVIRQISDPIHYLPVFVLRKAIDTIAVYGDFNVGEESKVRVPSDYTVEPRLSRDGYNLSSILNNIKHANSFDYARIEEALKNVNPNFKSIELDAPFGKTYLTIREENMGRTIGALHLSDGTLRFLLMEAIFYNPNRGKMIAIDEPERGLHPDMIVSVADMIKYASRTTQIIAATHSPHLLNQFKLEDVLVFEKDASNCSQVKRLTKDDVAVLEDENEDLLPGQLWLLGIIGGKRW